MGQADETAPSGGKSSRAEPESEPEAKSGAESSHDVHGGRAGDREATYRALSRVSDLDALHELVVEKGMEVLDLPFPYLVASARNRRRDQLRSERRRTSHEQEQNVEYAMPPAPRTLWDPFELVSQREELRQTLDALASMDDRDVLVVWLAAQGLSDAQIASEWDSLGFVPPHPSDSAIRKRRQRARETLSANTARAR